MRAGDQANRIKRAGELGTAEAQRKPFSCFFIDSVIMSTLAVLSPKDRYLFARMLEDRGVPVNFDYVVPESENSGQVDQTLTQTRRMSSKAIVGAFQSGMSRHSVLNFQFKTKRQASS